MGTGTPTTPTPTPGHPPERSILQESFSRHRHPQLKARSSAAHPALDWLYPALAAVAAVEQALLQPPTGFVYGVHFADQVCPLEVYLLAPMTSWALHVGTVCAVLVAACVKIRLGWVMLSLCWGSAGVMLGSREGEGGVGAHAGVMLRLYRVQWESCWGHVGVATCISALLLL